MLIEVKDQKQFEELISSNKKVVVDFFASWCGPCRMMTPIFKELSEEDKETVYCKVDVETNPILAYKFDISSIPTLIKFNNGKLEKVSHGFLPKQELVKFVK